jgi:hypothetical protein
VTDSFFFGWRTVGDSCGYGSVPLEVERLHRCNGSRGKREIWKLGGGRNVELYANSPQNVRNPRLALQSSTTSTNALSVSLATPTLRLLTRIVLKNVRLLILFTLPQSANLTYP